jgi:hypothetical protein
MVVVAASGPVGVGAVAETTAEAAGGVDGDAATFDAAGTDADAAGAVVIGAAGATWLDDADKGRVDGTADAFEPLLVHATASASAARPASVGASARIA